MQFHLGSCDRDVWPLIGDAPCDGNRERTRENESECTSTPPGTQLPAPTAVPTVGCGGANRTHVCLIACKLVS